MGKYKRIRSSMRNLRILVYFIGLVVAQKGLGIGERARWQPSKKNFGGNDKWNKKTTQTKKDWSELKLGSDKTIYRVYKRRATWNQARKACEADGLQLATVNKAGIAGQIFSRSGTYTWIGVSTDNGSRGRWYWAD